MDLRNQVVELFPTENPDYLYISYSENKNKQTVTARGCLYNHYRAIRKELRDSGIIDTRDEGSVNEDICQSKRQLFHF